MTATNHAATGALIVFVVPHIWLSLPLAFASHFILDSLPHFDDKVTLKWCLTKTLWVIDSLTLLILFSFLIFTKDSSVWVILGAIVAESPDLAWVYRYAFLEKWGKIKPRPLNAFNSFHSRIQSRTFKGGIFIEIVYLFLISTILTKVL